MKFSPVGAAGDTVFELQPLRSDSDTGMCMLLLSSTDKLRGIYDT